MNGTKYNALFMSLEKDILAGKYSAGAMLPSENALTRRFKVSRSTVQQAFRELEKVGLIARSRGRGTFITRRGLSRKIGLIVPGVASSEFFPPIVCEIGRLVRESGRTLLFGEVYSADETDRLHQVRELAAEFIHNRVAGVVYQPIEGLPGSKEANERILSVFRRAKIPVVLLDSDVAPAPARSGFDVVGINDQEACMRLTDHLLSVGARTVHFLQSPNCAAADENRYIGMLTALMRAGRLRQDRQPLLVAAPDDVRAVRRHLKGGRPDAFICGNDRLAAEFCQTLAGLGISVPEDMLLAGFGDLQIARLMTPPLTTVRQSACQLARVAFERLLERIENPALLPVEILLSAPLVVRASTEVGLVRTSGERKRK